MGLFDRNKKPDPAEGGEGVEQVEQVDDGITEIEGFEDPFEDDWDDGEMAERLKEWERMLNDAQTEQINSLNPGGPNSLSEPTATGEQSILGGENGGND